MAIPAAIAAAFASQAAVCRVSGSPLAALVCDAADRVEQRVATAPGSVGVVFHSIATQYFPVGNQTRIAAPMAATGGRASLAGLLALAQGGLPAEMLPAPVHPHGAFVQWQ